MAPWAFNDNQRELIAVACSFEIVGAENLAASGFHKVSAEALETPWAVSWIAGRVLCEIAGASLG